MQKKLKKTIGIFLCFALIVTGIPQPVFAMGGGTEQNTPIEQIADGNGEAATIRSGSDAPPTDAKGVYEIDSPEDLKWFADYVSAGNPDADAKLLNDITLNSNVLVDGELNSDTSELEPFTSIGHRIDSTSWGKYEIEPYTGTFDGGGHAIKGMYIKPDETIDYNDNSVRRGLFMLIGNGGAVKNLTIEDSYIFGYDGNGTGAICGELNGGTVKNCHNKGSRVVGSTSAEYSRFGDSNRVGGIVGNNKNGTITDCDNTGKVSGYNTIGGIAGANSDGTIQRCYNTGEIEADSDVGGIAGTSSSSSGSGKIENCYNTGALNVNDSGNNIGGIVGDDNKTNITNVYSSGTINVTGTSSYAGCLVGYAGRTTLKNSYYIESGGFSAIGYEYYASIEAVSKTTEEFKSGEVAWLLNGGETQVEPNVWGQVIDAEGETPQDTPVLNGMKVYRGRVDSTGELYYTNMEITASLHNYVNGICVDPGCGVYEPAVKNTSGAYEIKNAGNLYWFSELVNGKLDDGTSKEPSANAVLTADIVLNENVLDENGDLISDVSGLTEMMPIGYGSSGNAERHYSGTFDGQGHSITGMYIGGDTRYSGGNLSGEPRGLVGYLEPSGVIKNVGIVDSYVDSYIESKKSLAGALCGDNEGGTIENCWNNGSKVEGDFEAGGIVGNSDKGTIKNCWNNGSKVEGNFEAGGIVGKSYEDTIENCYNEGTVNSESGQAGGIAGSNSCGIIENCYNKGTVNSNSSYVGGITGQLSSSPDTQAKIINCFNIGKITSTSMKGAITGFNNSSFFENCYYQEADGLAGVGQGKNEGTVSKTTEQFKSGEVAWLLNGGETQADPLVWGQVIDAAGLTKQEHPVLNGKKVYKISEAKYSNSNSIDHTEDEHVFDENGMCICGAYEEAILEADGSYTVTNVGQLLGLANEINDGNETVADADINIKSDLTINPGTAWIPLGTTEHPYTGTLNGGGNTISGLDIDSTEDNQGIIGVLGNGGSIENVVVANSTVSGGNNTGAICGTNNGGTITNCCVEGTVTVTGNGDNTGGLCGSNSGEIKDCYNTGAVTGTTNVGGICGNNSGTVTRTYNTGTVTGTTNIGGVCGNNSGSLSHDYYLTGTDINGVGSGSSDGASEKNDDSFKNGEVAYLLNGSTDPAVWGQVIDLKGQNKDAYPVLGGHKVNMGYVCGSQDVSYSNYQLSETETEHNYVDGICSHCGAYEEVVAGHDGTYTISNTGQLLGLAEKINSGDTSAAAADISIDGTINITEENPWIPLGTDSNPYTGTLNGGGNTISGLNINSTEENQGLVGVLGSGGSIENIVIADSTISGGNNTGIICGTNNAGTITDCRVEGTVTVIGSGENIGGICGNNGGTITDCQIDSTVTVTGSGENTGGICGNNSGTVDGGHNSGKVNGVENTGGICGTNSGTVTGTGNTGNVAGSGNNAGGICGSNGSGANINNSSSTGTVTGSGSNTGAICGI